MSNKFENIYYAISNNGYLLINDNEYDYSQDMLVIELMKKYKKVILGDSFNQMIDFLPEGIIHLQLGKQFNKPIINLPTTLKILIIAAYEISYCNFNQSLDYLPESLESLSIKLNKVFNMPINNLPRGLKNLVFNCKIFYYPINNLPDELETLVIKSFDYNNTYQIPANLKKIYILDKLCEDELNALNKNLIVKYPNILFELNYKNQNNF